MLPNASPAMPSVSNVSTRHPSACLSPSAASICTTSPKWSGRSNATSVANTIGGGRFRTQREQRLPTQAALQTVENHARENAERRLHQDQQANGKKSDLEWEEATGVEPEHAGLAERDSQRVELRLQAGEVSANTSYV